MSAKSSLLAVFFVEVCLSVYAWGPVGHSTIVRLAQSQLTGAELAWSISLTPWHWNGNLSAMASWADDILYADANPTGYGNWQWSRPLHYVNIPDWNCEYKPQRDCENEVCVAGAVRNYTKRLETILDEVQRKEALYFLIHFMGDVHQPLHAGFSGDRGGNSVRGYYMGDAYPTNLHSLWDSGLLTTRLQRDFGSNTSLFYDHVHRLMTEQTPSEDDNSIDQWIKENVEFVCGQIYLNEQNTTMNASTNFTLGEEYYKRSIPLIEQRLAQGGRRLGFLLKQLANKRPQKPGSKLCAGTIALIAVLAVECFLAIIIGVFLFVRHKKRSAGSTSFGSSRKT